MELPLLQSWLPNPDPGFYPSTASFSWKRGTLELRVDLLDTEVITTASAHGQRLWEHGDVVELFVQRVGESSYREYQVAPNGSTLALNYPDLTAVAALRKGERTIDEFFLDDLSATSFKASVELTETGWVARFTIPLAGVPGERIRVSCCRYDAETGRAPIISSTSPHPVRDFHRPQDWREMILMEE